MESSKSSTNEAFFEARPTIIVRKDKKSIYINPCSDCVIICPNNDRIDTKHVTKYITFQLTDDRICDYDEEDFDFLQHRFGRFYLKNGPESLVLFLESY